MRKNLVITIARSYGSGGREIGEKLSRALNIGFYDKNLLQLAAERSGLDESLLESADEQIINRLIDPYALSGGMTDNTNEKLYRVESKLIREIADRESCVIVGRLADWVLRDRSDVLNVYITAPLSVRIQRVMDRQNLSEHQVKKLISKMDRCRKGYYNYFSDWDWNGVEGRDVILDSSLKGIDGTVEILKFIAENL